MEPTWEKTFVTFAGVQPISHNIRVRGENMPKKTFFNLPEEKRKRITGALMKYFATMPYDQVDIEDVARECDVAKGSMYQYFENKKDMYFYVIDEAAKIGLEVVKQVNFQQVSLFDFLAEFFDMSWNLMIRNPDAYLLLAKASFYDDSPYKEEIKAIFDKKTKTVLHDIVVSNQKSGFIRQDIPTEIILAFLESTTWGIKRYLLELAKTMGCRITELSKDHIGKIRNQWIELLKNGLCKI